MCVGWLFSCSSNSRIVSKEAASYIIYSGKYSVWFVFFFTVYQLIIIIVRGLSVRISVVVVARGAVRCALLYVNGIRDPRQILHLCIRRAIEAATYQVSLYRPMNKRFSLVSLWIGYV